MKIALNILLIFSVLSAVIPIQELYEQAQKESAEHTCCGGEQPNEQNHDSCTLSCRCYNNLSFVNFSSLSLSLEVKFIHSHANANKYIEEETESIFHPPIA